MASEILIYTTLNCPYCVRAKWLFNQKNVKYKEIRVDQFVNEREEMVKKSGRTTVPQIWIGDLHVGGFDELWTLDKKGELDPLLTAIEG